MEKIRDLIDVGKSGRIRENCKRIYVEGVSEVYVAAEEEVYRLLEVARVNRVENATNMN